MTKKFIISVIFTVTVFFGCVLLFHDLPKQKVSCETVTVGDIEFVVEVADTYSKKARGLSGRSTLGELEGMLFVFGDPEKPVFWMKDMLFPLDFIYINNDKIVDLIENVQPEGKSPIERMVPKENVRYILEVNAGVVQKYNIKIGDSVVFK